MNHLERLRQLLNLNDKPSPEKIDLHRVSSPIVENFFKANPKEHLKFKNSVDERFNQLNATTEHSRTIKIEGLAHERNLLNKAVVLEKDQDAQDLKNLIEAREKQINAQYEKDKHLALGSTIVFRNQLVNEIENVLVKQRESEINAEEQRLLRLTPAEASKELLQEVKMLREELSRKK